MAMDNHKTDGERLEALFAAHKAKTGMSRREFAKTYGMPGGQAVISQHVAGLRPISIPQAEAYMAGFGCTLAEISPKLAAKVGTVADAKSKQTGQQTLPGLIKTDGRSVSEPSTPYSPVIGRATAMLRAMDPDLLDEAAALVEHVYNKQLSRRKAVKA